MSYWPWSYLPADQESPVSGWTLDECSAFVAAWDESYGEQYAEAGSGAMSLGYGTDGAYAAANAVERPESDPQYVEARARLNVPKSELEIELAHLNANDPHNDLPF